MPVSPMQRLTSLSIVHLGTEASQLKVGQHLFAQCEPATSHHINKGEKKGEEKQITFDEEEKIKVNNQLQIHNKSTNKNLSSALTKRTEGSENFKS